MTRECQVRICERLGVKLQASQSANLTSNLETAKGLAIVTMCCRPSSAWRPSSVAGDPIVNSFTRRNDDHLGTVVGAHQVSSTAKARRDYGVVIDAQGRLDPVETERLRARD